MGQESGGLPQNSSDSVFKSVVVSDPQGISDLLQCLIGKTKCILLVILARSYLDGRHILGRIDFCAVSHSAGIGKTSSEDCYCGVC